MAMAGMTMLSKRRGLAARIAACGVAVALAAGCGGGSSSPKPHLSHSPSDTGAGAGGVTGGPSGSATPTGDTTGTPALAGGVTPVYPAGQVLPAWTGNLDKYIAPMKAADTAGLKVWIETDLVKAWLAGPDEFDKAIEKVTVEAKAVPDVVGFKVADELGKHDSHKINSPDQAMRFLHDVRAALHANDPDKLVMIDIIGTNLGCVPGDTSAATQKCMSDNDAYEEVTHLDFLDKVAKSGYVDEMNITTNMLLPSDYSSGWHISRGDAEKAAIAEMKKRGWDKEIILNTRKALSWPTPGNIDTPEQAAGMVPDFIDLPLSQGLNSVDVWSWSQVWGKSGQPVHLMSPGYTTNVLWDALVKRHQQGDKLFVHYTPSHTEGTLDQDMSHIAQAFTGVFCAAGTG